MISRILNLTTFMVIVHAFFLFQPSQEIYDQYTEYLNDGIRLFKDECLDSCFQSKLQNAFDDSMFKEQIETYLPGD